MFNRLYGDWERPVHGSGSIDKISALKEAQSRPKEGNLGL